MGTSYEFIASLITFLKLETESNLYIQSVKKALPKCKEGLPSKNASRQAVPVTETVNDAFFMTSMLDNEISAKSTLAFYLRVL